MTSTIVGDIVMSTGNPNGTVYKIERIFKDDEGELFCDVRVHKSCDPYAEYEPSGQGIYTSQPLKLFYKIKG